MFTFALGVVVGVVLAGLGILTLPKLKALWAKIVAKFEKKPVSATTTVTTPPPAVTPTTNA
jgi:hypothetical protein